MRSKRIFLNESQKAETFEGDGGGAGCAMKGYKQGCRNIRIERSKKGGIFLQQKMEGGTRIIFAGCVNSLWNNTI